MNLFKISVFCLFVVSLWSCGATPTKDNNQTFSGAGLSTLNEQQLQSYQKAMDQLKDQKPKSAEKILKKLLKNKPEVAELQINLALSQYQQNDFKGSKLTLDGLLKQTSVIAQAYNLAGLLAVQDGQFQQAIKYYQKALTLKPGYMNALYNMALLQDVYLQNVAAAIEYYQQYLQLNAEDQQTKDWVEHLKSSL